MKSLQNILIGSLLGFISLASHAGSNQDLKATSSKLNVFNGSSPSIDAYFTQYKSSQLLRSKVGTNNLSNEQSWRYAFLPVVSTSQTYAQVGNGLCVDFVKIMTDNYTVASDWTKGASVTSYTDPSQLVGKVIATFGSDGKYNSANQSTGIHTALVLSAWKQSGSKTVTNVWVVDANYVYAFMVGKHELNTSMTGVGNLGTYSVVKVYQ